MNEFHLINQYFDFDVPSNPLLAKWVHTSKGIGDDCAVLQLPHVDQCISTDTLVDGRHFDSTKASAYSIGYKAVAVNLSDIAAMGATPYGIFLALSLPHNNSQWLKPFSQGLKDICNTYNVQILGGDTTKSDILSITITAIGFCQTGQAILRSTAQVGDFIVVSNHIGDAAYALKHSNSALQTKLDQPEPQVQLGQWLGQNQCAHAMLDISDGLGQDLGHILKQSHVGATLQLDAIPHAIELDALTPQQRFNFILNGGDDYQLCFTCNAAQWQNIQQNCPWAQQLHIIGHITAQPNLKLYYQQHPFDITIQGYQHF